MTVGFIFSAVAIMSVACTPVALAGTTDDAQTIVFGQNPGRGLQTFGDKELDLEQRVCSCMGFSQLPSSLFPWPRRDEGERTR
jgi:hypothetical protein